ncbi:anti-repressor SinI family protein [Virgibacillus doumboii]|uniref:anti-repressor SinI family protein n=1 Tax=Virgibacillus doumboii TaxID=2697503 RepID=UPI0013DF1F7D|nr:anti-repressor SinI family protein [Virgibacillus doumboii]
MKEKRIGKLDEEWILLIKTAKEFGLSVEEVRKFLQGDIRMEQLRREKEMLNR